MLNRYQFENLSINFKRTAIDNSYKTILVSSCCNGDGKTTVAINLTRQITCQNQSVLIIDADLEQGTLSSILNVNNRPGFMEMAEVNNNFNLEDCILHTQVPNLDVLSKGSGNFHQFVINNPQQLLSTFKSLSQYDYFIFDAASIDNPISRQLAAYCDATLMVARQNKTPKAKIVSSIKSLHQLHANLMGWVLNAVK